MKPQENKLRFYGCNETQCGNSLLGFIKEYNNGKILFIIKKQYLTMDVVFRLYSDRYFFQMDDKLYIKSNSFHLFHCKMLSLSLSFPAVSQIKNPLVCGQTQEPSIRDLELFKTYLIFITINHNSDCCTVSRIMHTKWMLHTACRVVQK